MQEREEEMSVWMHNRQMSVCMRETEEPFLNIKDILEDFLFLKNDHSDMW